METSFIFCSIQGVQVKGVVCRLQPNHVAFELCQPDLVLRSSEVIDEFKVHMADEVAYSGRAVVTNVINLGDLLLCEVKLDEPGIKTGQNASAVAPESCRARYDRWFDGWQELERIPSDFKLAPFPCTATSPNLSSSRNSSNSPYWRIPPRTAPLRNAPSWNR